MMIIAFHWCKGGKDETLEVWDWLLLDRGLLQPVHLEQVLQAW